MITSLDKAVTKLELHYFFNDQSHTMDAIVRNKCEHELLSIFKDVATRLEINFDLESEALGEGGIKEIWNFIGNNSQQLTLILLAATLILSRVPASNEKLDKLRETELNLSIEEKNLNIERMKREMEHGDCPLCQDRCRLN